MLIKFQCFWQGGYFFFNLKLENWLFGWKQLLTHSMSEQFQGNERAVLSFSDKQAVFSKFEKKPKAACSQSEQLLEGKN